MKKTHVYRKYGLAEVRHLWCKNTGALIADHFGMQDAIYCPFCGESLV